MIKNAAITIFILILIIARIPLSAQNWTALPDHPAPGQYIQVAPGPKKGLVYAADFTGSVFKSADYGKTWVSYASNADTFVYFGDIVKLATHPTNPDALYVGTETSGLSWTNSGAKKVWEHENFYNNPVSGFSAAAMGCLKVSPFNTKLIVAGGNISTDGGNNWDLAVFQNGFISGGSPIIESPSDVIFLSKKEMLSSFHGYIMKSTNNGHTWSDTISKGWYAQTMLFDKNNLLFATIANNPLVGSGGFYMSKDTGANWVQMNDTTLPDTLPLVAMAHYDSTNTFYVLIGNLLSSAGGDDLYASNDSGHTWKPMHVPLSGVSDMRIDQEGNIYVTSFHGGIAFYDHLKKKWEMITRGLYTEYSNKLGFDSHNSIFIANSIGGMFKSDDEGKTWPFKSKGLVGYSLYDVKGGGKNYVYASGINGVYVSTDYGNTWVNKGDTLKDSTLPYTIFDHLYTDTSGYLYVLSSYSTSSPTMSASYDTGKTWRTIAHYADTSYRSISSADVSRSGIIYYIQSYFSSPEKVFVSTDHGKTYKSHANIPASVYSWEQLVAGNKGDIYLLDVYGNVYYSSDTAKHWKLQKALGINDTYFKRLFIDWLGNLYLSVEYQGVLFSSDHGKTWKSMNTGFDYKNTIMKDIVFKNGLTPYGLDWNGIVYSFDCTKAAFTHRPAACMGDSVDFKNASLYSPDVYKYSWVYSSNSAAKVFISRPDSSNTRIVFSDTGHYVIELDASKGSLGNSCTSTYRDTMTIAKPIAPAIIVQGDTLLSTMTGKYCNWYLDSVLVKSGTCYFIPVKAGKYRLTYTDSSSCESDFSKPYSFVFTAIKAADINSSVSIFPNPSAGRFIIETSGLHEEVVSVWSPAGQLCYKSAIHGRAEISLEGQPAGIYFVKVQSREGSFTTKVLVQQ